MEHSNLCYSIVFVISNYRHNISQRFVLKLHLCEYVYMCKNGRKVDL
jgi:hypothetical protein